MLSKTIYQPRQQKSQQHLPVQSVLLKVILILSLLSLSGCLIKTVIVRQSLSPIPEDFGAVLYVATNKPILIGIEGSDTVMEKDVGGYYLIHKEDLKAILNRVKNK